jgi:hypothetical protein
MVQRVSLCFKSVTSLHALPFSDMRLHTCTYKICLQLTLFSSFEGTRVVYVFGPIVSIIGTVIVAAARNVPVVLVFSPTMGITYATLFTMPYIVITQYHEQGMVSMQCTLFPFYC